MVRKNRLELAAIDSEFKIELKMMAAAQNKTMAELTRELGAIDGGIKRLKDKLRLL